MNIITEITTGQQQPVGRGGNRRVMRMMIKVDIKPWYVTYFMQIDLNLQRSWRRRHTLTSHLTRGNGI